MSEDRSHDLAMFGSVTGNTSDERGLAALAVADHATSADECLTFLRMLGLDADSGPLGASQSDETGPPVGRPTPATPKRHTDDWTRTRKVG
jgi:hypothetical protein